MNKAILNAMKFTDIRLTREEKNREKLFITADELDSSPLDVLNSTIFTSKTIRRNISPQSSEIQDESVTDQNPQTIQKTTQRVGLGFRMNPIF